MQQQTGPLGGPLVVDGTEALVRDRLEERLCVVGDLWFPTRAEMRRWGESPAPLYLRWTRTGGFEIGPRLETIPASRLVPTLRGRVSRTSDGRVAVQARMTWPRVTWYVLIGFIVSLVGWGSWVGWQFSQGETHLGWVLTWAVSTLIVLGGTAVAWRVGRRQLLSELPWLHGVLTSPMVEGEDW